MKNKIWLIIGIIIILFTYLIPGYIICQLGFASEKSTVEFKGTVKKIQYYDTNEESSVYITVAETDKNLFVPGHKNIDKVKLLHNGDVIYYRTPRAATYFPKRVNGYIVTSLKTDDEIIFGLADNNNYFSDAVRIILPLYYSILSVLYGVSIVVVIKKTGKSRKH